MHKSFIYNLLLFLVLNFSYAQNLHRVEYKMTTLFDGVKNYKAALTFSAQEACFEYKLLECDGKIIEKNDENGNISISIPITEQQLIYTNFLEKKVKELKYLKTIYLVEDVLSLPNWEITSETKIIDNYQCQKAITTFKGRTYEVWFTSKYATFFGPWKLNGLPGLIILAYDKKNEVMFEAVKIHKYDETICTVDISAKPISTNDFKLVIKNWQNDVEERLKAKGSRNIKYDVKFNNVVDIEIVN